MDLLAQTVLAKTTTIKSCCGILRFDEGEIYIDGKSIKSDPLACKSALAYIPDEPDMYEFLSGNKVFKLRRRYIWRVEKTDREERIHRYADEF